MRGVGVGLVGCVVSVFDGGELGVIIDETGTVGVGKGTVVVGAGLLKGDERYVRTSKVGLVLEGDR